MSYQIIYGAIYRGDFDANSLSHDARGVIRKLRHRGKTRHEVLYGEIMNLI